MNVDCTSQLQITASSIKMLEVCSIITNCCCDAGDKITSQLNSDADFKRRKPIVLQASYSLRDLRNATPAPINKSPIQRRVGKRNDSIVTQLDTQPVSKILFTNSLALREAPQEPCEQSSPEMQNLIHPQAQMSTQAEQANYNAIDNLHISGYKGHRQTQTMQEAHSISPMIMEGKQVVAQHVPQQLTPQSRVYRTTKSRYNPCNLCCFCCMCCCESENVDPIHRGPIEGNRSIILKPIRKERIVEVMVEEIQEKVVNVPYIQYVDKFVEVPKPVFQYKIKEVKRPVIVEKIVKVDKVVEEEKIVEVPEIRYVEKEVNVPHYVKKERIVEVPLPIVKERRIPVLKVKKSEMYQEVDNVNYNDFELNRGSVRHGEHDAPGVPNNTPIKKDSIATSNATKREVSVKSSDDERRLYESVMQSDKVMQKVATAPTMERISTSFGEKNLHNEQILKFTEGERMPSGSRTRNSHQSSPHISMSIREDSNQTRGETNRHIHSQSNSMTVMGFSSPRGIHEAVGGEANVLLVDEKNEVDGLVSIYPNIDAISAKSTPRRE